MFILCRGKKETNEDFHLYFLLTPSSKTEKMSFILVIKRQGKSSSNLNLISLQTTHWQCTLKHNSERSCQNPCTNVFQFVEGTSLYEMRPHPLHSLEFFHSNLEWICLPFQFHHHWSSHAARAHAHTHTYNCH